MYSDSDSESLNDPSMITPEYLESLLVKAKAAIAQQAAATGPAGEEELIRLDGAQDETPLPALDPGAFFPRSVLNFDDAAAGPSSLVRDLDDALLQSAPAQPAPRPPPPPKPDKQRRNATAGPSWFDLPAPPPGELPRLYREVEAIRLRNTLDPKRFYRKEEGTGKGIKGLPKHFAIGTILPSSTPFGTPSADNLPKAKRKRTVVDELVDDVEARQYAKTKFLGLQSVRAESGRGTYAKKKAARRAKW